MAPSRIRSLRSNLNGNITSSIAGQRLEQPHRPENTRVEVTIGGLNSSDKPRHRFLSRQYAVKQGTCVACLRVDTELSGCGIKLLTNRIPNPLSFRLVALLGIKSPKSTGNTRK